MLRMAANLHIMCIVMGKVIAGETLEDMESWIPLTVSLETLRAAHIDLLGPLNSQKTLLLEVCCI